MNRFVFSLLLSATLIGCNFGPSSDYASLKLVNVSGTVTLDGEPVEGAVVTFMDEGHGTFSYGLTNSSGSYSLQIDSQMKGATPGEKVVEISTTKKILGLNSDEEAGESSAEGKAKAAPKDQDLIPACYNETSQLKVEVSASQRSFDFHLKSDCSTKTAK